MKLTRKTVRDKLCILCGSYVVSSFHALPFSSNYHVNISDKYLLKKPTVTSIRYVNWTPDYMTYRFDPRNPNNIIVFPKYGIMKSYKFGFIDGLKLSSASRLYGSKRYLIPLMVRSSSQSKFINTWITWKTTAQILKFPTDEHCVKSVKSEKIRTRKISVFGHFSRGMDVIAT